ncbi:ABC transporter ATP-binding protein [Gaiella sp.]|uniref:ABC transporter ATP-binding protein n=1 Tax=Gaiella sp. TaxID=2663207 RepID=UPI003266B8E2
MTSVLAHTESSGNEAFADDVVIGCRDLQRRFGSGETAVDALRSVSLGVARGELVAIMGPSGSGKSTLMHLLAGLDRPSGGSVTIAGVDPAKLKDTQLTKLRRQHVGFIFQSFNLLPTLSAEENVTLPLDLSGERFDRAWIDELLESVGLSDRRKHRPAELSGGQQQRVAVARAIVHRPSVLFADEPTGNLDSQSGADVLALIRHAVDTYGQTTIMVTHDQRAAAVANRVVYLADGTVVGEIDQSAMDDVAAALKGAVK